MFILGSLESAYWTNYHDVLFSAEVIKSQKSGGEKAQVRPGVCLQNIVWYYTYQQ